MVGLGVEDGCGFVEFIGGVWVSADAKAEVVVGDVKRGLLYGEAGCCFGCIDEKEVAVGTVSDVVDDDGVGRRGGGFSEL